MKNANYFLKGLLLFLFMTKAFAYSHLQSVSVKQKQSAVILLCKFSYSPTFRWFKLAKPARLVIDFQKTVNKLTKTPNITNSFINRLRFGKLPNNTTRMVFDLRSLDVDFKINKIDSAIKIKLSKQIIKNAKTIHKLRDIIVVLDPGHGGKDPGARGRRGLLEKNAVLAIAKHLKNIINKQPGMRAVLTRSDDRYITLRERLRLARKHAADIFISIHADAFIHNRSHGASVFALSQKGATSEAARWLAEKENYSELGGVNLSDLRDETGLLRSVLLDLSQTATIEASLMMGQNVLDQLGTMAVLHNTQVEQAPFVVLKSPDIPSILIETGFISNLYEEKNLASLKYQKKLAQAIFTGLKSYFWIKPPPNTKIEALVNNSKFARAKI